MKRILVISGHPNLAVSNTNRLILSQLKVGLGNIEIRYLDELYPNYVIDVEIEQAALKAADIIVLQFPFHWYAMPALLKKWLDDVFSYNFAYGEQGDKLKGKDFILSFTVGGPEESYSALGYNHFTIEQLIHPLEQIAYLTDMKYHPPIYTHGMIYIPDVYNTLEIVQDRAKAHTDRILTYIKNIVSFN